MPDQREFENNVEEGMWRLKIEDKNGDGSGSDVNQNPYPDRPGAADCIYYLRTGVCGYGSNCRYNHPTYNGQGIQDGGELPERDGQPDCQYFLKTGNCKFGATCKYNHPRDRYDAQPAPLNILGLPLRQDEKSCPYYMRTGSCKFGTACKFNHPQPATLGSVFAGPSSYGSTGSSVAAPSSLPLIGGLSTWPFAGLPYLSSPRMQGFPAYLPFVLPPSQGALPVQQGWSTYTGSVSQLPSTDVQGNLQIPNARLHLQSGPSTTINLPERPDQPECQYYMKTGSCKYGTNCKYHHPKERYSGSPFTLGPLGLPLRPGHAVCTFYSSYGNCRYGASCKYDHPPMGFYNCAMPTLSISDPSALFPHNQRNAQVTWASSTEASAKTLKLPQTHNTESKVDRDNNNEHVSNPSPTRTSPSSNSAQNHSG